LAAFKETGPHGEVQVISPAVGLSRQSLRREHLLSLLCPCAFTKQPVIAAAELIRVCGGVDEAKAALDAAGQVASVLQ
jgi:hypothetical protein